MGRFRTSVFGVCYCVLVMFTFGIICSVADQGGCGGMRGCLKCDTRNSSDVKCLKCRQMIILGTRECVESCPPGYSQEWSTLVDYMGRVCRESLFLGGVALSGQSLAVVVGCVAGAVICLGLVAAAGLCVKYRRYRALRDKARQSPSLGHLTGTQRSQDSDDSERPEFLKHLSSLRSEAPVFLAMLNETRRQVRELRRPNRNDSTIQAYKPVLKDLSRILILLNRREERLGPPPPDWETLLAWGERVLRRYKKHNPNQVAQLVNFLKVPVQTHPSPPSPYPSTLTTFTPSHKSRPLPPTTDSSSAPSTQPSPSMQQLAINAFDDKYSDTREDRSPAAAFHHNSLIDSGVDFNPSWEFPPSNYTILAEWTASEEPTSITSYDDDFFQLGFRPQDEITTEL
ncbi:uncharacterized protein LOC129001659 [Macrosteles quadrilineatus]|uniref:uncharacterized protein LOC129000972 n=1 Tax=Macrosteles quadrilineatus TaxID=74068 RepID=UPI0023E18DB3|nr:uncharacterized protein LOC129000972 [Macrosteles quadrilineatus]XP_054285008.1 uncharacterized protein LOC129001659 [Macrosteles quadrilineatus]